MSATEQDLGGLLNPVTGTVDEVGDAVGCLLIACL